MLSELAQSEIPVLVQIEKLVHGGAGLAHKGSRAIFVAGVLPGERVHVVLNRPRKGYTNGRLVEVMAPSADRITPPCPVYGLCGGCQLQHATAVAQLELKRAILIETLARVGGLRDMDIPPVIPSPENFGYRSRARFAVFRDGPGNATLAYHREQSSRLVPIAECLLLAPPLNRMVTHLNQLLPFSERMGLQEVLLSTSSGAEDVVIHYIAERATRREAEIWFDRVRERGPVRGQALIAGRSWQRRRWAEGETALTEVIAGCTFRISDGSFSQANWKLNEALAESVKSWALDRSGASPLRVLELYAGIGNFGLSIAREGALVTLVEGNRAALADARANAKINHIGRCRFRGVSAEAMLEASAEGEYDLVVLDPPRTGLSKEALAGLIRIRPKRMLYVSCDSPTLARDLRAIVAASYRVARLQGYDMFPQTMHIETLVELVHDPSGVRD